MRAKGIPQDTGGWSKIYKDVVGHLEVSFLHSTITSINYFYKAFHPSNCPFFETYPTAKMSPWCVLPPATAFLLIPRHLRPSVHPFSPLSSWMEFILEPVG